MTRNARIPVSWKTPSAPPPWRYLAASVLCLALATPATAATPEQRLVGGTWQAQGPGPATNGQVENVGTDDQVVGAVHTVVAHPNDADTLWIGGVNAGLWKTTNATASSPNWTRLTDDQPSLSIGALALDPTDAAIETLVAGSGGFSSFGARGDRIGLLRTTDGGTTWTLLDGGGTLNNVNVSGVAPRCATIVVSANSGSSGIFRSTNTGAAFTQITTGDGTANGIPAGVSHDLVGDPSDNAILFTSVSDAEVNGGTSGFYRSTDTGASWTRVSSSAIEALMVSDVSNVEFAVGPSGDNVYAGIVRSGRLAGVFRSGNGGTTWTAMDLPETIEDGVAIGAHPGGQGRIHFAIVADPSNVNIVYLSGDRQPFRTEASGGGGPFFPNSSNAFDFSGRVFRGDASANPGSQWTRLTHSGTSSNSSPHADSREMTFDAAGNLIETDDGGIYKRTSPQTSGGDWFSLIGDLQTTEYHGISYDSNANIVFGGAQDTGTTEQLVPDMPEFFSISTADGGDTAVDDVSAGGLSTRFTSNQFLGGARRRTYNAANVFQTQIFLTFTPLAGSAPLTAQFYTPIAANEVDGDRLLIGGGNGLYESLDQGSTVTAVAPGRIVNAFRGDPLLYGVPGNADLVYFADGPEIFQRTAAPPAAFTAVTTPGGDINDLAIDPDTPTRLFASDSNQVFFSTNAGTSWADVTSNLISDFDPGTLRTLAFIPGTNDALVVGTNRGIYVAFDSTGFTTWDQLGSGLPNALVYELDYDIADDVLIAGLVGRGAFKLQPATDNSSIFADGFESGNTTAWTITFP
ncbi:MAG: RTX toxin [Acidobacteriota bacterium]